MISIIGDYFSPSGYGVHCRQLSRAINKIHPVKIIAPCPPEAVKTLGDDELEMLKRTGELDINLIIAMPMFWRMYADGKRNWTFLVFEGDKIPRSWLIECMNPDIEYIFCPSNHTYQAVLKTLHEDFSIQNPFKEGTQVPRGMSDYHNAVIPKLRIMPHGVDGKIFYPKEEVLNSPIEKPFIFLMVKGWRNNEDRGGAQYGIKSYLEEFTNRDNVLMTLKINPAYGIPDINKLIAELKPAHRADFAPIQIIPDNVPYEKMAELYNQCDVFVSPTRAEAFNLGCIEAMACGKPVITTNFGGQTDYVSEENGWLIGGDLEKVKHETLYEGISWLNPYSRELRKTLRWVFEHTEDVNKKGELALQKSKEFFWEATARKIVNLI